MGDSQGAGYASFVKDLLDVGFFPFTKDLLELAGAGTLFGCLSTINDKEWQFTVCCTSWSNSFLSNQHLFDDRVDADIEC